MIQKATIHDAQRLCNWWSDGAEYITADVAKLNEGSNAVLRKLGFKIEKEGTFKKSGTDIVYKIIVIDYK